jgi:hypothetical protein
MERKVRSTENTKIGKKEETLTENMNGSSDERHKQTHGGVTELFQRS